jgi:hypothetical protein
VEWVLSVQDGGAVAVAGVDAEVDAGVDAEVDVEADGELDSGGEVAAVGGVVVEGDAAAGHAAALESGAEAVVAMPAVVAVAGPPFPVCC